MWRDRVNERAKGGLIIKHLGASEAIPKWDQPEAVRKGVVDIGIVPTAYYYKTLLPEGRAFDLCLIRPMEQREPGGFYDYMVEAHKKANMYYVGRWMANCPCFIYTNILTKKPEDLAGQRIRTGIQYDPLLNALGASPVTLPQEETYTALERGLVDGAGEKDIGIMKWGWHEVLKYMIDEPFFGGNNGVVVVNLDSWNRLPKQWQDLLAEVGKEIDSELWDFYAKVREEERQKVQDAGVEFLKFSPEDGDRYRAIAMSAGWEALKKAVDPAVYAKLRKLTGTE